MTPNRLLKISGGALILVALFNIAHALSAAGVASSTKGLIGTLLTQGWGHLIVGGAVMVAALTMPAQRQKALALALGGCGILLSSLLYFISASERNTILLFATILMSIGLLYAGIKRPAPLIQASSSKESSS